MTVSGSSLSLSIPDQIRQLRWNLEESQSVLQVKNQRIKELETVISNIQENSRASIERILKENTELRQLLKENMEQLRVSNSLLQKAGAEIKKQKLLGTSTVFPSSEVAQESQLDKTDESTKQDMQNDNAQKDTIHYEEIIKVLSDFKLESSDALEDSL